MEPSGVLARPCATWTTTSFHAGDALYLVLTFLNRLPLCLATAMVPQTPDADKTAMGSIQNGDLSLQRARQYVLNVRGIKPNKKRVIVQLE